MAVLFWSGKWVEGGKGRWGKGRMGKRVDGGKGGKFFPFLPFLPFFPFFPSSPSSLLPSLRFQSFDRVCKSCFYTLKTNGY